MLFLSDYFSLGTKLGVSGFYCSKVSTGDQRKVTGRVKTFYYNRCVYVTKGEKGMGGGGSGSAERLLPSLLGQESQVPAEAHTPGIFKRDRVRGGRGAL